MKKTALLAALAAAFVSAPALAGGGHVGVGYGTTETDVTDGDTWQLEGAFGGANGSVGYQIDGGLGQTDVDGDEIEHHTIAGHLYWHTDNWNLGGVVATAGLEDDVQDIDETAYGVEGTFNVAPNFVLLGSYTQGETEFLSADVDTWNADIGVNFYINDNFRIGGVVGSGNLDFGIGDLDISSYGVGAEWQMASMPLSFRAGYNTVDADVFGDYDTFTLGARWNFGGTLRERDSVTPFETSTGLYQRVYALQ